MVRCEHYMDVHHLTLSRIDAMEKVESQAMHIRNHE